MLLTNADILSRFSSLADCTSKLSGGSITTAICSTLEEEYPNTNLDNWYICILTGKNKGLDRLIDSTNSNTITFLDLPFALDATTEIAISKDGFLRYMEDALLFIKEKIKNDGRDFNLFLNQDQLKEIHLYKTIDLICLDKFHDADTEDLYWSKHILYSEQFETTYAKLVADYDLNESGTIEDNEKSVSFKQIKFTR